MSDSGAARRFEGLSADDKNRFREFGCEMVRLAQKYAVPIIFAPPPAIGGVINGGTGSVLKLSCGYFAVTASYVLVEYENRLLSGEKLNWQVGHLPPFDPLSRIAWRDRTQDTLLLRLSEDEAHRAGSLIASAPMGWPPPIPKEDQQVLVAGYPKVLREVVAGGIIGADYLAAMFRVTDVRDSTFDCKIGSEEDLVTFNGLPLPDEDMDMGGLSGGPAFLVVGGAITYPVLVGVVSDFVSKSFDGLKHLRIATLKNAIV